MNPVLSLADGKNKKIIPKSLMCNSLDCLNFSGAIFACVLVEAWIFWLIPLRHAKLTAAKKTKLRAF